MKGCFLICFFVFWACNPKSELSSIEVKHYSTGEIERKCVFGKSGQQGYCELFHKSGLLKGKMEYMGRLQHGKTEYYYQNGQRREVQYYVNGKKEGADSVFYENGKIFQINQYLHGRLEGDQLHYDRFGTLLHHGLFQADTLVKLIYTK